MVQCFESRLAGSALFASNEFLHYLSVAGVVVTSNAEFAPTKLYALERITPNSTLVLHGSIAGEKLPL